MSNNIAERVKNIIIEKLQVEEVAITPEASFEIDLKADSLEIVELIMQFEEEFKIVIPDEQADKIKTVGEAIAFIEANV